MERTTHRIPVVDQVSDSITLVLFDRVLDHGGNNDPCTREATYQSPQHALRHSTNQEYQVRAPEVPLPQQYDSAATETPRS